MARIDGSSSCTTIDRGVSPHAIQHDVVKNQTAPLRKSREKDTASTRVYVGSKVLRNVLADFEMLEQGLESLRPLQAFALGKYIARKSPGGWARGPAKAQRARRR